MRFWFIYFFLQKLLLECIWKFQDFLDLPILWDILFLQSGLQLFGFKPNKSPLRLRVRVELDAHQILACTLSDRYTATDLKGHMIIRTLCRRYGGTGFGLDQNHFEDTSGLELF